MRAGLITGKERFELVEVEEPRPEPDEVVVAVSRCGICGSDVHAYVEGWPYNPGVCGHEWIGTVAAAGADVTGLSEGDRVAGAQAPGCGRCRECVADLPQYCAVARSEYSGRAAPRSGGFAPYLGLKARRLIRLPDGLDDDRGALGEPASVAVHAVRRSRLRVGDVVCVVGCGPIGLLVLQWARLAGAGHVIAVEPDVERRALAVEVGADVGVAPGEELREEVDRATGRLRADVAFDCAGIPQTLQSSVDMVRMGGSVCMVGVSGGQATITPMRWMMKEVSVDTALLFTLEEMRRAAAAIADDRLRVRELHHGTVDLDGLGSAISDLATRRSRAVKVLVDPSGG